MCDPDACHPFHCQCSVRLCSVCVCVCVCQCVCVCRRPCDGSVRQIGFHADTPGGAEGVVAVSCRLTHLDEWSGKLFL